MTTTRQLALLLTCTVVAVLSGATLQRREASTSRDEGFTTIEWVVIALGLFLVAGIAVAAINGVVQDRLDQIV